MEVIERCLVLLFDEVGRQGLLILLSWLQLTEKSKCSHKYLNDVILFLKTWLRSTIVIYYGRVFIKSYFSQLVLSSSLEAYRVFRTDFAGSCLLSLNTPPLFVTAIQIKSLQCRGHLTRVPLAKLNSDWTRSPEKLNSIWRSSCYNETVQ